MILWSPKQFEVIQASELIQELRLPMTVWTLDGPVRSGKTKPGTHSLARHACRTFAGHDFIVANRTGRQLQAINITYLREFAREHQMRLRHRGDYFELDSWLNGPPNRFWPLIGENVSSVDKAGGFTAAGALVDEALQQPEEFVRVIMERCSSVPGSLIFLITNPGAPKHWVHADFIEVAESGKDPGIRRSAFTHVDNETLTPAQIRNIHKMWGSGVNYERRVLGKWIAAEGLVYPFFTESVSYPPADEIPYRYAVSVDHARASVTHALLFGYYKEGIWAIREWRHDHERIGPLEDLRQAQAIYSELGRGNNIANWICDPSAPEFARVLGNLIGKQVIPAENDVSLGIEKVTEGMGTGLLNISPACKHLIDELHEYSWDEQASRRGEDKPVKIRDHGADALRYFALTMAMARARARQAPRIVSRVAP